MENFYKKKFKCYVFESDPGVRTFVENEKLLTVSYRNDKVLENSGFEAILTNYMLIGESDSTQ